jgi:hypothetical protein
MQNIVETLSRGCKKVVGFPKGQNSFYRRNKVSVKFLKRGTLGRSLSQERRGPGRDPVQVKSGEHSLTALHASTTSSRSPP